MFKPPACTKSNRYMTSSLRYKVFPWETVKFQSADYRDHILDLMCMVHQDLHLIRELGCTAFR